MGQQLRGSGPDNVWQLSACSFIFFYCSLGLGFGDGLGLWLSSGHLLLSGDGLVVRVRVLGYGFGVRGRKVKSRDCALASDLVRVAGGCAPRTSLRGLHAFTEARLSNVRPNVRLSVRKVVSTWLGEQFLP